MKADKLTLLGMIFGWVLLLSGCGSPTPLAPIITETARPLATPSPQPVESAPGAFPMFHGNPEHTSSYSAPALRKLAGVKWKFKTDGIVTASVAVTDGLVYFGSGDKNFYALDAETGTEKWHFSTQDAIHSSAAVSNGLVYFQSNDGFVYALDAQTGRQKWKADTGPGKGVDYDFLSSSPVVVNGILYIGGANGNFYALDSETGQSVWTVPSVGPTAIRSSPAVADGVVYFTADNNLLALDARTGELKWKFQTTSLQQARSSPTLYQGLVLFGNNASMVYAIDKVTGKQKWTFRIDYYWVVSSATVAGDTVYIGGDDSYLNALDLQTGKVKWRFNTKGETIWSSPAFVDGILYFGDWNYQGVKDDQGNKKWGYLYAVDAATGKELWNFKTGDNIVSSPVVDQNGVIYFGSNDGFLYALDGSK
jgi:eukaryotic-like serine/threonine-protein kinase